MSTTQIKRKTDEKHNDRIWQKIREETRIALADEPILASFMHATILHHEELINQS